MSLKKFILFKLILLFPDIQSLKVIETSYGRVRGITEWSDDNNHKYMFKSVPFAKPPIGKLRFAPPQYPDSWSGVLDASKYSPACLSNSSTTSTPQEHVSEDCLYINIFTSEKCLRSKCAVIVYFHGGAYNGDSATMFPDNFILERYVAEDVILAIPGVRLGVFGQLYFGPSALLTENLFMFDAVQALDFVHNEIPNFGGDPKQVTIMGHSSGGTLVEALGFSNSVDPDLKLFQQIIVLSGTGMFGFYDLLVDNSFIISEKLGCFNGTQEERTDANIAEILECMRQIDGHEIVGMQKHMEDVYKLTFKSLLRGAPFMELNGKIEKFRNSTSPRNAIFGTTEYEFRNEVERYLYITTTFLDFENPVAVAQHFDDELMQNMDTMINGDAVSIFVSAAAFSSAMANAGADVYLFETRQWPYSFHVSDMQYFIGIHREVLHTHDMDILDSFYSKLLVNFTKTGAPSPEWNSLEPEKMNYLELRVDTRNGKGPVMLEGYHDKEVSFWYGDMMDYDRNITKMRQSKGLPRENQGVESQLKYWSSIVEPRTTAHANNATQENISTSTNVLFTSTAQYISREFKNSTPILQQWWFYLIIALVVMIFVLIFISLRKPRREEEVPLLS
ncbi:Carboxylic ester hydrolase [Caenorhabditis elegans]|uniref:Carboxylic ester hydrolase n=1 Tax=Caenorhabditis elegans TaxID=6239 RepID=Q8MQC8_CAEEL|nr:Carboxylic ester hydrolase [Caenorhabditis elegans]CAD44098.3 Carboxylic ester hydrolase [Caenorhabditis elegans]|eukprot:NP_741910.3 Carboxylic ester hydrolase [Caenorhabditis elegans]